MTYKDFIACYRHVVPYKNLISLNIIFQTKMPDVVYDSELWLQNSATCLMTVFISADVSKS